MRHWTSLVLLLLLLLLPACSYDPGGNSTSQHGNDQKQATRTTHPACPTAATNVPAAPESGNVTLTVTGALSSPAEDALVQANLQRFHLAHPNIQVKWSPITSGDYPSIMRANIANGNAPDVFYLQPPMAPDYFHTNTLLDLSPYMAQDNVPMSAFGQSLISPFSCSGQVYGIPKDWSTLAIFYNKQMLQKAGLAVPPANWTWNDLRLYARKLTVLSDTHIYGITLAAMSSRWLAFLFANGGSVLNANGTRATFNNQAGVDALNFYASFQKDDGSSVMPVNLVAPAWRGDTLQAFGEQRVAMVIEGSWLIPYMQQKFPSVQYGIAPLPFTPAGKRANLLFTNAWAAYRNTRHPEAAWELIKYLTGQEAQGHVIQAGFALPSLKSLATDAALASHPDLRVFLDAGPYSIADYFGVYDDFIHHRLDLAVGNVLSGNTDAQTALDNAATQINQVLQS